MPTTKSPSCPHAQTPALPPELAMTSPDFVREPYRLFAQMRANAPVHRMQLHNGDPLWLVSRHADVVRVLRDTEYFTVESPHNHALLELESEATQRIFDYQMLNFDGAEHKRLRRLVAKAFTPRYISSLAPRIQTIADQLLDEVMADRKMDFIRDFAFPLPLIVIGEMLGFATHDRERLRQWSSAITASIMTVTDAHTNAQLEEFIAYLEAQIADKRANPGDDLLTAMVHASDEGQQLSGDELLSMTALLVFAGHETTVNLLGNGMYALFQHPDQLARLCTEPDLIPQAIEEMLRYCGPIVSVAPRFVRADVELGGQLLRTGEAILVAVMSANHDASVCPMADSFDLSRTESKHVAFGQGNHFCLGAPLARLEARIALQTVFARCPDIRLDPGAGAVEWRGNQSLRGLNALPVVW